MYILIKNGRVVTADKNIVADILVKDEKILKVGKNLACEGAEIIDAKGKYVFPGAIDMHVHLNLFFCGTYSEDWDTSTAAAACGGVTSVIDYAIQMKGGTLKEAIESRIKDAEKKVAIDYSLHGGITDWNENTKNEMNHYTKHGIPSFKMFMIYRSQGWMADDAILFAALEETRKSGAMIMLHAESAYVLDLLTERYHTKEMMEKHGAYCHTLSRPDFTEYEAIQRAALWARVTGGRVYIVHMSTAQGAEIVARAQKEGVHIWGETCPQYLLLDDNVYKGKTGHYFGCCPQIKKPKDAAGLLKGIKTGSVGVISTDTCTFNTKQKDLWNGDFTKIPFGMPGLETLVPTMYSYLVGKKKVSLKKFVELISTNPAKLFGMYPRKGDIRKGCDADLVIFDPEKEVTVDHRKMTTKCDWSPFQGMKLKGYPILTISRGKIVARDGKFTGKAGWGKFIARKPGGKI